MSGCAEHLDWNVGDRLDAVVLYGDCIRHGFPYRRAS